jgi:hypothetical protein
VLGIPRAQFAKELQAGFLRHLNIRDNNSVFGITAQHLTRGQSIRHRMRCVAIRLQNLTEKVAACLIVIDYQNFIYHRFAAYPQAIRQGKGQAFAPTPNPMNRLEFSQRGGHQRRESEDFIPVTCGKIPHTLATRV